jgi:SOS-response transcriptional repressor LexA
MASEIIGHEEVPVADISDGAQYVYLQVQDNVMQARSIGAGSLVLIRQQATVPDGAIAAIHIQGKDAVVRHIRREGDKWLVYGASTDPDAAPRLYQADEIQIVGRVVRSVTIHA